MRAGSGVRRFDGVSYHKRAIHECVSCLVTHGKPVESGPLHHCANYRKNGRLLHVKGIEFPIELLQPVVGPLFVCPVVVNFMRRSPQVQARPAVIEQQISPIEEDRYQLSGCGVELVRSVAGGD